MHHRIVSGSFDRQTNWRRLHGLHKVEPAWAVLYGWFLFYWTGSMLRAYLPTYCGRPIDRSALLMRSACCVGRLLMVVGKVSIGGCLWILLSLSPRINSALSSFIRNHSCTVQGQVCFCIIQLDSFASDNESEWDKGELKRRCFIPPYKQPASFFFVYHA